ncbi:unnamed protein product [Rotaria socialis]|uniref:Uncharacterized protein n=1 Tax=Rotaria socialis TaxID=392032 RepID=A0A817SCM1_9BILA|nr:unnamed protein product [Rotaria socialis]
MAKEACKGGKRSKERFTVLLCTNMTGTGKLIPLLIGQYLVKHVLSRYAVATSSDDIIITALDAIHWTKRAWQAVTQSTICNTFRTASFVCSTIENVDNTTINSDSDSDEEILTNDISTALQNLDLLLAHLNIGGTQRWASQAFLPKSSEVKPSHESQSLASQVF